MKTLEGCLLKYNSGCFAHWSSATLLPLWKLIYKVIYKDKYIHNIYHSFKYFNLGKKIQFQFNGCKCHFSHRHCIFLHGLLYHKVFNGHRFNHSEWSALQSLWEVSLFLKIQHICKWSYFWIRRSTAKKWYLFTKFYTLFLLSYIYIYILYIFHLLK